MAALIDIIGAGIIVGILFLTIFGLGANLSQASYENSFTYQLQSNTTTIARIIESDLVKVGYHVPAGTEITAATASSVTFKADLKDNGTINTVQYYVGTTSEAAVIATKNPRDIVLYRVVDGQTIEANVGVTGLQLKYFDAAGNETMTLNQIRSIYVKVNLESPERAIKTTDTAADTSYPGVFWEKTVFPRNL